MGFKYQAKNLYDIDALLGYSRCFTEKESWTITFWKNERSLESFLKRTFHKDTINKTYMVMRDIRTSENELSLNEATLSRDEVEKIVDSNHRI